MRRVLPVVGSTVALLILATPLAAASSSVRKPSLSLVSTRPVTVRGLHYAARERVVITFRTVGATTTPTVSSVRTATAAGVFTAVASPRLAYDPCSAQLVVRAVGTRGEQATLRLPLRQCPVR